jgi:peptidoglycan/xylan/chitin deacetylase (PgdA/CDA1 family)
MRTARALFVAVALIAALVVAGPLRPGADRAHAASYPRTFISLEFDDGNLQQDVGAMLHAHGMHGTFYINSGYVGTGRGYFTWDELHALAADGNEIAGHTLTHRDLATLSADEKAREICGDRRNLIEHGFQPVDFAYPYGSYDDATEAVVPTCGYQSGRAAWGLWGSGCESQPRHCPYAVDPNNIPDRWAIPTADAPIDLTYLANLQQVVTNAEQHGGGWVQIFWHRICRDDCDEYSWHPRLLDQFMTWLGDRKSVGTVVETPQQVLGEQWHGTKKELAATHVPPPPPPPSGSNHLRNPGLERVDHATGAPACWELSGGGDWSRVAGVSGEAEEGTIAGAPDGYAAIAQPLDQGECSPAVQPGDRLRFSLQYRTDAAPRIEVWARNDQGGWAFWTDGPRLDAASSFTGATWDLPPIPAGVTAISIGVALTGNGTVAVDDLKLRAA